jgi:hypothetical protein
LEYKESVKQRAFSSQTFKNKICSRLFQRSQTLYNQVVADVQVTTACIRGIYSIALGSAQFVNNPPGGSLPAKVSAGDIVNADIGGAAVGAQLDPANPFVGALIGGVAGSAIMYTAEKLFP